MKVPDFGERARMRNEAHDEKDEVQAPETEWARRCSGHLRSGNVSRCNGGIV